MYKVALPQKTWSMLPQFQKVSDGEPVIGCHHVKSYAAQEEVTHLETKICVYDAHQLKFISKHVFSFPLLFFPVTCLCTKEIIVENSYNIGL